MELMTILDVVLASLLIIAGPGGMILLILSVWMDRRRANSLL